jgi:hypothetical protein
VPGPSTAWPAAILRQTRIGKGRRHRHFAAVSVSHGKRRPRRVENQTGRGGTGSDSAVSRGTLLDAKHAERAQRTAGNVDSAGERRYRVSSDFRSVQPEIALASDFAALRRFVIAASLGRTNHGAIVDRQFFQGRPDDFEPTAGRHSAPSQYRDRKCLCRTGACGIGGALDGDAAA